MKLSEAINQDRLSGKPKFVLSAKCCSTPEEMEVKESKVKLLISEVEEDSLKESENILFAETL